METSHENSRFRSQLLEKTLVLNHALLARLKSQFLPSATATVATFATVEPSKHNHTKIGTTVLLVALLATCQPSYANNVKVQQRVNTNNSKVYIRVNSKSEDSSQLEKINQLSFFDSFNCVDKVAVTGNNLKQERRKLLATVLQHHTIVDVFLCLSFANLLVMGELRLALALVRLWWGGHGNKPFGANTVCRVVTVFYPPYRPNFLGQSSKSLPVEKV